MMSSNDDNSEDKEPVAGLSAASSCIRLSLCLDDDGKSPPSHQFLPVYTHQCFPREFISGWRPLSSAEQSSQQVYQRWRYGGVDEASAAISEKHSSYKEIDDQCSQIEVNVLLSPSCNTCKIEVTTSTCLPGNNIDTDEPATKKAKKVAFDGADDRTTRQLSIEDVIKKVQSSVPPIVSQSINGIPTPTDVPNGKPTDFNYLSHPIGAVVKNYKRNIKDNNNAVEEGNFVITLAKGSDPSVASYHNAIQPLARWFIETADDVNISDEDGGFWTVLYLFRKHEDKKSSDDGTPSFRYSLAGYTTLFHFHAPFRKPNPGIIVRVCQALILPTYQRAGHGSDLLLSVHEYADSYLNDYASSTGMDIVEVNVEDPAPGFVALRDSVDYKRFISLVESLPEVQYLKKYPVTNKEYFQPAPDGGLSLSSVLKITKRQAEVMHEIYKLSAVERWKLDSNDSSQIQQVETYYRLMVKKSLKSHRTEELGACAGGKEEQKALLAKWFDQTYNHYRKILGLV